VSKWPESDDSIASLSCLGGLVSKWPDCDLLGEARSSQLCMVHNGTTDEDPRENLPIEAMIDAWNTCDVDLSLKLERRKEFIRENPFSHHLCATVFSIS
jgi:hypothetical protein